MLSKPDLIEQLTLKIEPYMHEKIVSLIQQMSTPLCSALFESSFWSFLPRHVTAVLLG